MQELGRVIRTAGIVIALMGVATLLWVVLLGPALLLTLHPR